MLIILDGLDCAGKSTFTARIAEALRRREPDAKVTLLHRGPPDGHALDEYLTPLLDYRPERGEHVVCDRWHLGEWVYPRVLDRPTTLDAAVFAYVELFLQSRGAFQVICTAPSQYLHDCGVARGDPRPELDRIDRTTVEFARVATRTALPTIHMNVTAGATDRQVDQVIGWATDDAMFSAPLNDFVTYVGGSRPTRLLLGDRRGPTGTPPEDHGLLPAFVPRAATSGHYLLRTLTSQPLRVPTHGTLLSTIGLANACDVDDPVQLWETLGRPATVALGRNAARELERVGVPHHETRHPQYWRRFHYHTPGAYLDRLLNVRTTAQ